MTSAFKRGEGSEPWQGIVNNVETLQKAFGGEQTTIEVVAHGKGLGLLLVTNTALQERLWHLAETGVVFAACENTMQRLHVTKAGLPLPVNIAAVMMATSIPVTDSVSTSVPSGSPSRTARCSACRTIANDESKLTVKSYTRRKTNQIGSERSANQSLLKTRKSTVVSMLNSSGHSRPTTGLHFLDPRTARAAQIVVQGSSPS